MDELFVIYTIDKHHDDDAHSCRIIWGGWNCTKQR